MKQPYALAKELIAYQTDGFKDRLIALFTDLLKIEEPSKAQASNERDAIVSFMFKRTGLKINLIVDTNRDFCCFPIMVNTSHGLGENARDEWSFPLSKNFYEVIRDDYTKKGTIDLKNAKVSGVYSKMENTIFMSQQQAYGKIPPAQVAGVFMHEVGHCFLAFDFMARTHRASQILAALHQQRTNRTSNLTYDRAFDVSLERMHAEGLISSVKELDSIKSASNSVIVSNMVFSVVFAKLADDFNNNGSTHRNYEALCDNFATRFGFGQEVASFLVNDGKDIGTGVRATLTYIFNSLAVPLAGFLVGLASTFILPVAVIVSVFFTTYMFFISGANSGDAYDTPVARVRRIRNAMIEGLKVMELSPSETSKLLTQLNDVERMISGKKDYANLWTDLSNFLLPSNRASKAVIKLEQDLESLTSNNLFVGAATLASIN